jgi:hypothetical protein
MAQLPLSIGKQEFNDGVNWFALASENWVLNNLLPTASCLVATTGNLSSTYANGLAGVGATLTNSVAQVVLVIDGVTLVVGNRVLVKDQTVGFQNGVYSVTNVGSVTTNWVLTRASDYDVVVQTVRGNTVATISGTVSTAMLWMLTSTIIAIGTDVFTFIKTDQSSFNSLLGTTNQIAVSVVGGVATISIVANPVLPGTGSVTIPTGTTEQRPVSPTSGMLRLNTSL